MDAEVVAALVGTGIGGAIGFGGQWLTRRWSKDDAAYERARLAATGALQAAELYFSTWSLINNKIRARVAQQQDVVIDGLLGGLTEVRVAIAMARVSCPVEMTAQLDALQDSCMTLLGLVTAAPPTTDTALLGFTAATRELGNDIRKYLQK